MDLSEPAVALAQGLTMPVLRALSRRTSPATAAQVHRAAGTGTFAGVQRACERLVTHGLVLRDEAAGRVVYVLNDRHVLYDALQPLLRAQTALRRLLTTAITAWEIQPVSAALFGSAARGDGDVDSDVDLLLVQPPLRGGDAGPWRSQVRSLGTEVQLATGNRLQAVVRSRTMLRALVRAGDPIVDAWRAEAVTLAGEDLGTVLDGLR